LKKPQTITIEPPAREVPVLGLSIDETAEVMGMGRTLVKQLISSGTLHAARFGKGKKVVIYIEEIKRVLTEATAKAS
jgi:excisionase family DNA binding protein